MVNTGSPVLAGTTAPALPEVFEGLSRSIVRDGLGPAGFQPQVLRVRESRKGPSGVVDELVLDARVAELRQAASIVTVGNCLVGYLSLRGDDQDRARVRLLSYHDRRDSKNFALRVGQPIPPPRVAAQAPCREIDAQGTLHFLVEPSRSVDPWPLRCTLLDDPYLASRLRRSGGTVTTSLQSDDPGVPAGLLIGNLMIWGYPSRGIPVGLFVKPSVDPQGISAVTIWRPAGDLAQPRLEPAHVGRFLPVRFSRYPAPRPVGVRWLVTSMAGATLPDGAALIDSGRFLGRLHAPWAGQSLVTPFAASTRSWTLLVKNAAGVVTQVVGRIVGKQADGRLRIDLDSPAAIEAGDLFTGTNGRHCPAGFYIGKANPGLGPEMLVAVVEQPVLHPEVFLLREQEPTQERDR
jgi:hypothetical protein